MPTGAYRGGGEVAIDLPTAVTHLDDYSTFVDTEREVIGAEHLDGASAWSIMDVIDQIESGYRLRLWDGIFFGIIHVIPRKTDVGAVISEVRYQVEIWNADESAHLGESVAITGSSGVSLENGPTLPAWWPPFSSFFTDVVIDEEGDAAIDTLIDWSFPGFTGTDHQVIGVRLEVYGVPPTWDQGIEEVFGYLTDIIPSRNRTEQRIQLRALPERELSFASITETARQTSELMVLLFSTGRNLFALPYWPDAVGLDQAVSIDDVEIFADTTTRIFAAGSLALLWRSAREWEALRIDTVSDTSITLEAGTTSAWAKAGTYLIPVLKGRLQQAAELSHPSSHVGEVRSTFRTEL